jgi:hypothetical protein
MQAMWTGRLDNATAYDTKEVMLDLLETRPLKFIQYSARVCCRRVV